jgi:hypothetical protein
MDDPVSAGGWARLADASRDVARTVAKPVIRAVARMIFISHLLFGRYGGEQTIHQG